ncbi:polysaccharide deacetylase family protein [Streptococcus hillyeri]|uniref:Polysaccharide deacetylase family protein n=1 Tax=Streptococcus hillyeri TaxID=2282420 RepID=A0A3L9DXT9_9STRE|nr:polysaccharide deacetylase family protein [Streptococcus hillyeri]RLY04727.1 polysaccharide deacetylase family protein [Streptococcus hillyeri]
MSRPSRRSRHRRSPFLGVLLSLIILLSCFALFFFWKMADAKEANQKTTQTSSAISQVQETTEQAQQIENTSETETVTWTTQEQPVSIPILMYHAIHVMAPEEAANANLIVAPDIFESHIKRLKDDGYYFLSPEEAYRALTENSLPAEKVVWLTFDDSLWDFYDYAYPILAKYGAKATNNVITGTVNHEGNLTVEEMQEMKANGISLQGHTVNHPDLEYSTPDTQTSELSDSKTYLDQTFSQDTIAVAYPAGRYSDTTINIAQQLHYKLGVTTNEGVASAANGLLTLNRVRMFPTTTADELISRIE